LAEPVRLLGVGVTNLVAAGEAQLPLLEPAGARARRARLNRALDAIRDRFGTQSIARGGAQEPERAGLTQQRKRGEPLPGEPGR
jgi:hypothetical protein